jgi:hypothetical protein
VNSRSSLNARLHSSANESESKRESAMAAIHPTDHRLANFARDGCSVRAIAGNAVNGIDARQFHRVRKTLGDGDLPSSSHAEYADIFARVYGLVIRVRSSLLRDPFIGPGLKPQPRWYACLDGALSGAPALAARLWQRWEALSGAIARTSSESSRFVGRSVLFGRHKEGWADSRSSLSRSIRTKSCCPQWFGSC